MNNPFLPSAKKDYKDLSAEEQGERTAQSIMAFVASCPGKAILSLGTGYALGGLFGFFMASMAYDTPMGQSYSAPSMTSLPLRQQMKIQLSDMWGRTKSSAKNFAKLGFYFSGVECVIESLRGKSDLWNGALAGCVTGGGLAVKTGPTNALVGCAGFAAFSTAIDMYMKSENGKPPANDYDE
ncbi:translocation channel protein [Martiniozyma asiatica (nom. inval.)]|nr:translocation channel protein [Martiniozyma asiatica]